MDETWVRELIMFSIFWVIGLFIWFIWVDGVYVLIFSFITAIIFRLIITVNSIINKKCCK
ncbi:MAG TPA: hypothetical protein VJ438_04270 [Candidatus Nanoarchaeia archaeon]|nr:hypothetical protein [Candidatus Nanoarchaeia archaeon]